MSITPVARGRLEPDHPGGRPCEWAATGRSGGVSAPPFASLNLAAHVGDDAESVAANRSALAGLLGLPGDRLAVMEAVHGRTVAIVDGPVASVGVDALVTQEPGLAIVALGADCLPLALLGSDGRTIGVVHCGWQGLAADVIGAAVTAMADAGAGVRQAILGPTVCGTCYPVSPQRLRDLRACVSAGVLAAAIVTCSDGQPGIDVRAAAVVRLVELGVVATAVLHVGGCTVEDPGLFSYRRDGLTGRQGIAVCLAP
jgi:YfiH family protein